MKTLLLNPPKQRRDMFVSREESGVGLVNCNFLPSNILLAAAYLRSIGKEADPVDVDRNYVSFEGYDTVVVWVSVLHSFYDDIEYMKNAKVQGKRTVMVLNDAYDGLEMEAMQRFNFIDAAVRLWEREIALERLLNVWEENGYPEFEGVVYRRNGELIDTGYMPCVSNLEHLPSCSDIIDEFPLDKYGAVAITTGRGCSVAHNFCLYGGTQLRRRRIEDVVSEMEVASRVGKVLIIDPAMPLTGQWMEQLLDRLISDKIKVSWRSDAYLSQCNEVTLRKFKESGCEAVMLVVETLSDDVAQQVGGGTSHRQLKTGIEKIKKAGIIAIPVFHIGFPWDSNETLSRISTFLQEVPVPSFILKQVRPWKGVGIYDRFSELGLIERDLGIDDYVHSDYPIADTLYLSRQEVEEWKYRIRKKAILNWRYIRSFLFERKQVTARQLGLFLRLVAGLRGGWDNY